MAFWRRRRTTPVFELSDAQPCLGASVWSTREGLKITTASAEGSCALKISSKANVLATLAKRAPILIVRVAATVLSGKVVIGCAIGDGLTSAAEVELADTAGNQQQRISLLIETVADVAHLFVRNGRTDGDASTVILAAAEVFVPDDGTRAISISLRDAQSCGQANISWERAGLSILTPSATWSYAVQIPVVGSSDALRTSRPAIVCATLVGRSGRIGFGALASDGSTFLDESEIDAACAGACPVDAKLLIDDLSAVASLVVRNRQPLDQPSAALLKSVQIFIFDDLAEFSVGSIFAVPPILHPVRDWPQYYGNRADNLLEKFRRRIYRASMAPFAVSWLEGLRIWLYPGNQISGAVAVSGLYEPGILIALKELLPRGGVFLDIGANMGLLSLYAARLVGPEGEVHAFEPSPREYARLQENIQINKLDRVIRSFPMALGAATERRTLHVAEDMYSGLNTFGSRYFNTNVGTNERAEVPVQTLDQHASRAGLRRIDLLKIDTEGFETFVLRGGRETLSRWHPPILLEVSPDLLTASGSSAEELEDFLRAEQYRFYALDDGTGERWPIGTLANAPTGNVLAMYSNGQDQG